MTHNPLLLLLFDSSGRSSELAKALQGKALPLVILRSEAEARRWLETNQCQAILLAVSSLQPHGVFLAELQEAASQSAILVAASAPSVNDAVAALQAGAVDYIEAPVSESRLDEALDKAGVSRLLPPAGQSQAKTRKGCAAIIGTSSAMRQVFSLINKVCDAETTVLVRGESGTGKELIAQALHYEGVRGTGPFVPVNCGAIPGELLESELFGHEKGAFTHAIRTRLGRFELANGGTVFLDEISEMSPMLQVKLLRVLQEKEFERIGGTKTISSDFRVVAATNRDLEQEVEAGRFREDLYYRLNVIPIEAPPLRERRQDIPLLVEHFVARFNRLRKKKIKGVSDEVMARLARYAWPGNVRELENMLERMVILAGGDVLSVADLPERLLEAGAAPVERLEALPEQGFFLNEVLSDFEKRLILQALEQTDWVKNRAAKLLNVNRTTLIEKMKRFKLVSSSAEA
ncbi:MAG: sigma-54 dependent transcriptional regulator [Proteobacteria bacterium]|nr:sigma-54 dependent transcriptional regulator [Pseudomonadota bacterium]MBU1546092.1 sigma-54 dependent transcriptional regulator [Pseudomonadota bacterium]MBU2620281.1 sigma-54 dependent transcriptional regulator [Pseudomonadota bacterium]